MNSPSQWRDALSQQLDTESIALRKLDSYYRGKQPLRFLDPEVRRASGDRLQNVSVNLCRLVVDSLEERLDVEGFRTNPVSDSDAALWQMWQANGMDEMSQQAHLDALVFGCAYVLVWAGQTPALPRITVESPLQTRVVIDPGTGGVVAAIKRWQDSTNYGRAEVFTVSEVARFRSRRPLVSDGLLGTIDSGPGDWVQFQTEPNMLGVVPVVPIVNRPRLMNPLGESELSDVMPLVDAMNKLATDMLTSAEFHAQPRRWATGLIGGSASVSQQRETSEQIRAWWESSRKSKVWAATNPDTKFGQFPEAQLDNFIGAIKMLTTQIAAVAGLPPHYLGLVSDNAASADAIRSAEASLVKRAYRKQRQWGGAWESVMRLAVHVRDGVPPSNLDGLETIWRSPETRTIAQSADAAAKLFAAGIIDQRAALEEISASPAIIDRLTEPGMIA